MSDLLQLALDDMVPSFADATPDWADVVRRSRGRGESARASHSVRRARTRSVLLAFVVLLLAVAVAAPALGFQPPFLNFFTSKHAAKRVVHQFAVLNVGAPIGMSPHVIAGQTRLVTTYHLRDGKPFPLWLAPTRSGGFCYVLGYGGGCVGKQPPVVKSANGDLNVGALDVSRLGSTVIAGSVFDEKTTRVEIHFGDGGKVSVPLLWVSPPIDRGFYFYELTRPQQNFAHRPTSVAAVDAKGHVTARVASIFKERPAWFNPAAVSNAKDRHVILRSGDLSIATAPSRTGGSCWWLRYRSSSLGSGCAPPRFQTLPLEGGLSHGVGFTGFDAQVKPKVYRVTLRFQDGDAVNLRPVEGHVLYDIPQHQWLRGHRLFVAIAYDRAGKRLAAQWFHPEQTGVYDCKKTIRIGAGQYTCP